MGAAPFREPADIFDRRKIGSHTLVSFHDHTGDRFGLEAAPFDRLIPVVGRPLDTKARVVPIEASVESGGQSGSGIQNERPDERCGAIARLV